MSCVQSHSTFSSIPTSVSNCTGFNPPAVARPVTYSAVSPLGRAMTRWVVQLNSMRCCPSCSTASVVLLRAFWPDPSGSPYTMFFFLHIPRVIEPFEFIVCRQEHGQPHHAHPVELRRLCRGTSCCFHRVLAAGPVQDNGCLKGLQRLQSIASASISCLRSECVVSSLQLECPYVQATPRVL